MLKEMGVEAGFKNFEDLSQSSRMLVGRVRMVFLFWNELP